MTNSMVTYGPIHAEAAMTTLPGKTIYSPSKSVYAMEQHCLWLSSLLSAFRAWTLLYAASAGEPALAACAAAGVVPAQDLALASFRHSQDLRH